MLRKVLLTVVGHVDHGKSSILDAIRGSTVAEREAGLITQAIGASIIPLKTINRVCAPLLEATKQEFTVPGLLAIDTPGHAAFTNLRKRGGSLADIAVVVIDLNEGFRPQTEEAVEILKASKTPFIIAANKVDLIPGWQSQQGMLLPTLENQSQHTTQHFDTKFYELLGQLYEKFKLNAERFDRVEDYTKQVAIVPVSAKTKEGIPELLMVIMGLAQKFLEQSLQTNTTGPGKGTILEVKDEKGLGTTLDAIIYDGHIQVGDTLVIGGLDQPIITKVKALFEPTPLAEMREKRSHYQSTSEVHAATGVKISAKEISQAIAGMPFEAGADPEDAATRVQEQVEATTIETQEEGIIIKADALGSLEALITLLKEQDIPIRRATIGNITKKDVIDAESNREKDPLLAAILGFNVTTEASSERVKVLTDDVIYKLIENFQEWRRAQREAMQAEGLEQLTHPFKAEVLRGYVFRQSNPAIFGTFVSQGTMKTGVQLMRSDGKVLGTIKNIQSEKEQLQELTKGNQAAVSVTHVTMGRQLNEGDTFYAAVPEDEFRRLKEFKQFLTEDEKEILREIAEIKRKESPLWGV